MSTIYAIYKGEDFLCEGTTKEISEILQISKHSVIRLNSPSYKKRLAKNFPSKALVAVKIEEDEE